MKKISSFARVRKNIAKMGYYPTAQLDVKLISTYLTVSGALLLDPCCGEGIALGILREELGKWPVEYLGVEIEETRASTARLKDIGHIFEEDFFNVGLPDESFGCVFLNPPYDQNDQLHQPFIERSTNVLAMDGILVLLLPAYEFQGRTADFLASNYKDFKAFKSTDPTFKQVIVFGKRKPLGLASGEGLTGLVKSAKVITPCEESSGYYSRERFRGTRRWIIPEAQNNAEPYSIPDKKADFEELEIQISAVDPATLKVMLDEYKDDWNKLINMIPEETVVKTPLMPMRRGHFAQVLASGLMDGAIKDPDTGEPLLIKGTVKRVTEVTDKKEATETSLAKEIKITRDVVSILLMDNKGVIIPVT